MYRPSATALANTIADLPFSAVRVLIFNIIVYFMTNLNRFCGWILHFSPIQLCGLLEHAGVL